MRERFLKLAWGPLPHGRGSDRDLAIALFRRAMSILETTIALGILGVGLIMVAAIFPVALSQHRETTDRARATELTSKAQAMIQARLNQDQLWVPNLASDSGQDTPWYLLPSTNLHNGASVWDGMPAAAPPNYTMTTSYANVINDATEPDLVQRRENPDVFTPVVAPERPRGFLAGLDTLSDRLAPFTNGIQSPSSPFTDAEFADASNRLVWYGFYRRLGGKFIFAAAICRQQRSQLFVEQDLSAAAIDTSLAVGAQNPYSKPTAVLASLANARRLPVPWRVSVGGSGGKWLFNTATAAPPLMLGAGLPLGRLAPPGSRIMIQGAVHEEPFAPTPTVAAAAGRILTVAEVLNDTNGNPTVIEVLEDIRDLPSFVQPGGKFVTFDIWVFPPPLASMELGKSSPLLEWNSLL